MFAKFVKASIHRRPFTVASAILLELVGLAHAVRLIAGWDIVIADVPIPMWVSGFAAGALIGLAALIWLELWRGHEAKA